MEELKKRTEDMGKTSPISPQLENKEESVLPNSSLELTADMDTSSPLVDLKLMIDRTFGGTDSPADDSSRSGSVKSIEMDESTSSPDRSLNMALAAFLLDKFPIEERQNIILAALKKVPINQQVEMLSETANIKHADCQTLPVFASRAIHFESQELEIELGSPRTWCNVRQPTPYPSRILDNQVSNTGVPAVEAPSSIQPLERFFGISEDSVYEDAKETVVCILEQPPALDQSETEQRARALVHALHQPINNYIIQQKARELSGPSPSLMEPTDEVIRSGNLAQISGRVAATIMASLAACSCLKPFQNLFNSMAGTMRKLSAQLKSKAVFKEDPGNVLPAPGTLTPSGVPAKSANLNDMQYSTAENITTFSKEDLTKVTQAASEVLVNASRCISTELLPMPDDVDAEVMEIVRTVASDMQRLYDSTEESSSLKELITTAPIDGTEQSSMASCVTLNSALAGIYRSIHGKIKSLFCKFATLETEESDTTPVQEASSETRPVSSFPISPGAFQATSSSPVASCPSPRVSANLEVSEIKEKAAEVKKYEDAEAELSGLMQQMLFIREDPASVEAKLDILLCSGGLRPRTDQLAKEIHAFMQENIHARVPVTRRCASHKAIPSAKTTRENQSNVITQEGFKDLVYVFTESKITALLENLVGVLLTTPAAVKNIQCSHSAGKLSKGQGGCRNRLSCTFQEITGLFSSRIAKKVSDAMCRIACCLPLNRTEQVMTSHAGRELRSVVNQLVARNMAKIKVDNQEVSMRVSTQVLSLVCVASVLKEDQVYPEDINTDEIYKSVKKALRSQFGSKEGLRTAAANNDPLFERSLVCFLTYALVRPIKEREGYDKPQKKPPLIQRLFQKKAKQEKACQAFSKQNNITTPSERCSMPSVVASPEESPATEQRPEQKSLWVRF